MSLFKKTCASTMLIFTYCSSGYANTTQDPFVQQWVNKDGVNTYVLTIEKSNAPNQDYRIKYRLPEGFSSETDFCKSASPTAFNCLSGEIITRDDAKHAVTLASNGKNYLFYDPQFIPAIPNITGTWSYTLKRDYYNFTANYNIIITKGESDTQFNVITSFSDSAGNHCNDGFGDSYTMKIMADGTQVFNSGFQYEFIYNPVTNEITSTGQSGAGYCAAVNGGPFIKK